MLFLYRPRQTYMPFRRPRSRMEQDQYNLRMQQAFSATRQVPPAAPAPAAAAGDPVARLRDLARLHETGALTDAEFAAAKAKVLDLEDGAP
ncbi:MAG TPA: SHOCT domain-containing protein [Acidimicrobiales bacterium]|nr:SHOCT domain-containing protein [Acidimicrobiales bacterium]